MKLDLNFKKLNKKTIRAIYAEVVYLTVMSAFGILMIIDGVSAEARLVSLLCFLCLWINYFFVKLGWTK